MANNCIHMENKQRGFQAKFPARSIFISSCQAGRQFRLFPVIRDVTLFGRYRHKKGLFFGRIRMME